ncbi:putative NAD/FAD-binding protein [Litorivivens lipolytica]|uniref:Putative NAD/FAD-binding protein n=1 Tax=Litorivivens lipolytica TaxID=1524264 RepID=A0A7W4W5G6_9GAMM|nr:FAD-dependent oxidoreductase [Litorivivens lipolytica]MBB3047249.1 putative NAD/FAD-binding protein [Litorivivens lipolytica]
MAAPPLNIAVVGSGIAGLSAAWLLSKAHTVTVFEREQRLGGHSNTVDILTPEGRLAVDTGFIVFNKRCYPNLVNLFNTLGVEYQATDMSFGVSINQGELEYAGADSLRPLFAQKRNLLRPRFWRMIRDLIRFYRDSDDWLKSLDDTTTLGDLLARGGYGDGFRDDHLIPMGAAIWSTPAAQMADYPAKAFLQFCENHGLLQLSDRPQWQTVVGGSREYVRKIGHEISGDILLGTGISRIERHPDGVSLTDEHGVTRQFDHVVLAGHADQSLAMLGDASVTEQALLSQFRYEHNTAWLHCDPSLMPRRKGAWASWCYLSDRQNSQGKVAVSYWMNRLQHLPGKTPIIVTLNPTHEPAPDKCFQRFDYEHPQFNVAALQAQRHLWDLQGTNSTWFCGSYFGHGFHEDGIQSGLAVAEALGGVERPWKLDDPNSRIYTTAPMPSAEAA